MKKKKPNHGGARKGAGAPRKFKDPVTTSFKFERADIEAARAKHGRNLNGLVNDFIKGC